MKLSIEFRESLEAAFAVQRDDFFSPQLDSDNFSRGQVFTSNIFDTSTKNVSSEKSKETVTDLDSDDISINISYPRNEVLKILDSLNISFAKNTSTDRLNTCLKNRLQQDHPIHQYLKGLDLAKLKDIANKASLNIYSKRDKMCKIIATYFFKFHPNSPLTSLRKCMTTPACQAKINKNHPIFEFLKTVPDTDVKEWTNRLGKKNLRNFNSMRSFLGHYFFDHDKNMPLESL